MLFLDGYPSEEWVYLSHILDEDTPAYGNGPGLTREQVRSLDRGESCNASMLHLSNHLGSHVDAPNHFIKGGRCVDQYSVLDWFFLKPLVLDVQPNDQNWVTPHSFETYDLEGLDADLLFIQTHAGVHRKCSHYWENSPVFAPELSDFLKTRLPSLRAVGLDTISISSLNEREVGREAHRTFLGSGLRIFEDMNIGALSSGKSLDMVIALPMRIRNGDAAPCTVIGRLV